MKLLAYTVSILVVAAIIAGFIVIGSPDAERARRFDQLRIQHLQAIQNQIRYMFSLHGRLPDDLMEIQAQKNLQASFTDPKDNQNYIYNKKTDMSFELCADFETFSQETQARQLFQPEPLLFAPENNFIIPNADDWNHGIGLTCFERSIVHNTNATETKQ